jgi:hypothetical protein
MPGHMPRSSSSGWQHNKRPVAPCSRVLTCAVGSVQVPVALATSQPERRVKPAIERLNMTNYFDAVVTAEDNGSPEVRKQRSVVLTCCWSCHTLLVTLLGSDGVGH